MQNSVTKSTSLCFGSTSLNLSISLFHSPMCISFSLTRWKFIFLYNFCYNINQCILCFGHTWAQRKLKPINFPSCRWLQWNTPFIGGCHIRKYRYLPALYPLDIVRVHSPSLVSPQLCVVKNAHSLKPISESSCTLQVCEALIITVSGCSHSRQNHTFFNHNPY